jgi:hypothetical protein
MTFRKADEWFLCSDKNFDTFLKPALLRSKTSQLDQVINGTQDCAHEIIFNY